MLTGADIPDSISVADFINTEKAGRKSFHGSKRPYTCGVTGTSWTAEEVARRVDFLAQSTTMSERPLIVVDANSQHDDARGDTDWNVPLFIQDSLEKPRQNVHWPCSYEEAAEAVTRSAPVKVLMFRHVAYLQNLLRQGESGEKVEEFIERSARVYRYWNTT